MSGSWVIRGKSYTASRSAINETLTGETATFPGKPFAREQFNILQRHQPKGLLQISV
jgi:hypothetical protein